MKTEKEIKEKLKDIEIMQDGTKDNTKYQFLQYWIDALRWVLEV